jgi:hypothetical protein
LQKKTVGKSNMTLGELAKFCIEHNQIPDEDSPHEPFVLDFQIFGHILDIPIKISMLSHLSMNLQYH